MCLLGIVYETTMHIKLFSCTQNSLEGPLSPIVAFHHPQCFFLICWWWQCTSELSFLSELFAKNGLSSEQPRLISCAMKQRTKQTGDESHNLSISKKLHKRRPYFLYLILSRTTQDINRVLELVMDLVSQLSCQMPYL